jgi:hypothetical protein
MGTSRGRYGNQNPGAAGVPPAGDGGIMPRVVWGKTMLQRLGQTPLQACLSPLTFTPARFKQPSMFSLSPMERFSLPEARP